MRKARLLILLPILFGVSALPSIGAPNPISAPIKIYKPGKYIVTNDITVNSPATPVISVKAPRVEIDLNGFTLTNTGPLIRADGVERLVVRSGELVADTDTVVIFQVNGAKLVVIEDVRMSGGLSGIELHDVPDFEIRRNRLTSIGGDCGPFGCDGAHAILVDAANSSGTIEDNTIRNTQSDGIHIDTSTTGTLIRNNSVVSVASAGIYVRGGFMVRIERNRVSSGTTGIDVSADNSTIEGNNVVGGFVDAISLTGSDRCLIFDNVAIGALNYGIRLTDSDHNHVDRNLVVGNFEGGLYFTGDENTYGRNTVRDNHGTCPTSVSACDNTQVCDVGTANNSFGDNLAPGGC